MYEGTLNCAHVRAAVPDAPQQRPASGGRIGRPVLGRSVRERVSGQGDLVFAVVPSVVVAGRVGAVGVVAVPDSGIGSLGADDYSVSAVAVESALEDDRIDGPRGADRQVQSGGTVALESAVHEPHELVGAGAAIIGEPRPGVARKDAAVEGRTLLHGGVGGKEHPFARVVDEPAIYKCTRYCYARTRKPASRTVPDRHVFHAVQSDSPTVADGDGAAVELALPDRPRRLSRVRTRTQQANPARPSRVGNLHASQDEERAGARVRRDDRHAVRRAGENRLITGTHGRHQAGRDDVTLDDRRRLEVTAAFRVVDGRRRGDRVRPRPDDADGVTRARHSQRPGKRELRVGGRIGAAVGIVAGSVYVVDGHKGLPNWLNAGSLEDRPAVVHSFDIVNGRRSCCAL